ncbi:MAG: ROK family transcriptional regulator [Candidatus Caldatribacteriota bacterium]|jgi:predicted NBD/HSP70 family sugar kinase|nr:ROK family transcriptional regulator [Verrucomicrobiota bacterium]MDD4289327.1 ROK family transcriptional regulator [Atribacterota bacterium]
MDIKNINQGLVLKVIENNGPISRAAIGKIIGLTPPTISAIVRDLINRGIVSEIGKGDSSGGKKPILIQINSESAYIIAVDLGSENGIRVALMDLSCDIVKEKSYHEKDPFTIQNLKNTLSIIINDFLEEIEIPLKKILNICIGVPGIIDYNEMKITAAPYLNWEISINDLSLSEPDIPIILENDVNLMALGEKAKGIAQEFDNFVFVGERTGIGAGIIINGKLHQGANNAVGEIGYLLVDPEYAPKNSKDFGCLEKLASSRVIIEKARKRIGKQVKIMEIFKLAAEGDSVAAGIIKETLKFLAYGIGNISCVLNPELVVIGGGISILPSIFLEEIKTALQNIVPFVPRIEFSKLREDSVLIGAAVKVFAPLKKNGLAPIN